MGQIHQRIFQLRVLEAVFHHGIFQACTVRISDAFGQTAGHDVAHLDGYGDDLHPFDQRATVIDAPDKVVGHTFLGQQGKHVFANQVVDLALADDAPALEPVEGKSFITIVDHRLVRVFSGIEALSLSLGDHVGNVVHASSSPCRMMWFRLIVARFVTIRKHACKAWIKTKQAFP